MSHRPPDLSAPLLGEARVSRLQAQVDALQAHVAALEGQLLTLNVYAGGVRPRPVAIVPAWPGDLPDVRVFSVRADL